MLRFCLTFRGFFYPNYAYKRLAYNFFLVYWAVVKAEIRWILNVMLSKSSQRS